MEANMEANIHPHGTFPMVTPSIPLQLETNMETTMEPNMDFYGTFPIMTSPIYPESWKPTWNPTWTPTVPFPW